MQRRFHHNQPDSFEFTPNNLAWVHKQLKKYPLGRQSSAIIPVLMRAQEQEGWLSQPAVETTADLLGIPHIRAYEVATFYFMFQLQPTGSVAHIQVCGTTTCMICGSEDLIDVCKSRIAPEPHQLSKDGKFSWEEVECLGACSNAPMVQIGKDYYEDLDKDSLKEIIDEFSEGRIPQPGSRKGRFSSEPASGSTTLNNFKSNHITHNAAVSLALESGDTVKRIDGS